MATDGVTAGVLKRLGANTSCPIIRWLTPTGRFTPIELCCTTGLAQVNIHAIGAVGLLPGVRIVRRTWWSITWTEISRTMPLRTLFLHAKGATRLAKSARRITADTDMNTHQETRIGVRTERGDSVASATVGEIDTGGGTVETIKSPAPNPCLSCPYRRDVPSGVWAPVEYELLAKYDGEGVEQPWGLFQCHQNGFDSGKAQLCAGWVACHGPWELMALRLAAAYRSMDPAELERTFHYSTTVAVFGSGVEAAAHGMRDIDCPSDEATAMVEKIAARRSDVRYE